MSETKLHETLINRGEISTLRDYCKMKHITISKILHNNHGELKPYENKFGRKLTRADAIIISALTQPELNKILNEYDNDKEFQIWRKKKYEERIKDHENHA